MRITMKKFHWAFFLVLSFAIATFSQTSPSFNLEHNVIAAGGGQSSSANFLLEGSVGQSNAGSRSLSASFILRDGFWSFVPLAPTAANVSVSGRVLVSKSRGISQAFVTITDPVTNLHFQTYSNHFGNFNFAGIPAGGTYIITVSHGRHLFDNPSQTVSVVDDVYDLHFYAVSP